MISPDSMWRLHIRWLRSSGRHPYQGVTLPFLWNLAWLLVASPLFASAASTDPNTKPRILGSIAPIASWAMNVAGDDAVVECLLPADVGPHEFQFSPRDLKRIRNADLILVNGLEIESWLTKAIRENRKSSSNLVVLSSGMEPHVIHGLPGIRLPPAGAKRNPSDASHGHDHDHAHGSGNPHVWLDPQLAIHAVSNLIHAIARIDPSHSDGYHRRGNEYISRLHSLDSDYASALKAHAGSKLVTFHDAFPYLARRYDLALVGVIEEVPAVEPSPKYLSSLMETMRQQSVRVIFSEPQLNPRLAQQIARDLGIRVVPLDVLETGKATPSSYEDGMRKNLAVLQENLRQPAK